MRPLRIGLSGLLTVALIAGASHAGTRAAASTSYADVSAAVSAASANDTVAVPAGSATWPRTLTVTKGLVLKGAGLDKTIITNGTADHSPLIKYQPANYDSNDPFRLTGFSFDLASNGPGLALGVYGKKAPFQVQTKIRIDHNRFTNDTTRMNQAIWNYGGMYGVVNNNRFNEVVYPIRNAPQVGGSSWWDNFTYTFGAADDNLYFEDNVFTGVSIVADSQYSGRYAFRYNDITLAKDAYPLFDMHGNQVAPGRKQTVDGMYSTFGGELYGNQVNAKGRGLGFLDQRGGKALVFCNNFTSNTSVSMKVRKEYADAKSPTTNLQPQHVSDSYYWNNRRNNSTLVMVAVGSGPSGTATGGGDDYLEDLRAKFDASYRDGRSGVVIDGGRGAGEFRQIVGAGPTRLTVTPAWTTNPDATSKYRITCDCCNVLAENREFFNHSTSFDGTSGIGLGPLSAQSRHVHTRRGLLGDRPIMHRLDRNGGRQPQDAHLGHALQVHGQGYMDRVLYSLSVSASAAGFGARERPFAAAARWALADTRLVGAGEVGGYLLRHLAGGRPLGTPLEGDDERHALELFHRVPQ